MNLPRALDSMDFTVERFDGFSALPSEVHWVLSRSEAADFQGGSAWFALLCETALQPAERPLVHLLRADGRIVAVLPTLFRPAAGGLEVSALANFYTTRFVPAVDDNLSGDDFAILFRTLRQQSPRACRINLSPLDRANTDYPRLLQALRRAGFVTFEYFCFGNWYLPVAQDFDAYMAARPGELRSTLRRMSRRIESAGGRVEIVGPDGDIEAAITAFNAVYASSWKQPEPFVGFIPGLIRLCASKGWLRMGIAWLADKPIAVQLWVVNHGKASIFKLAYDSDFASYSPGTVLTAALMRHAMDIDQVNEIDYMTGDDAYKQAWMTQRRELWGLMAHDPRNVRGALQVMREISGRAFKRALGRFRPSARA